MRIKSFRICNFVTGFLETSTNKIYFKTFWIFVYKITYSYFFKILKKKNIYILE